MDSDFRSAVMQERAAISAEKDRRRNLIHESFPEMGKARGSHEGSQSNAPSQIEESQPRYSDPSAAYETPSGLTVPP